MVDVVVGPMRPYVRRHVKPKSAKKLRKWAKSIGLPTIIDEDGLHLTVIYSQTEVDFKTLDLDETNLIISFEKMEFLGQDGALVLKVKDYPYLVDRFKYFIEKGAESKFDGYVPHITLTFKAPEDFELTDPPDFQVMLGPEELEPIDTSANWRDKVKETEVKENHYQARTDIPRAGTSMEAGDTAYDKLKKRAPKLYQFIRFDASVPIDPAMILSALLSRMSEDEVLKLIKSQLADDARKMYSDDYPVREALRVKRKK